MQVPMMARTTQLRNNRGQALVEFALLLPLVMLILIGIVEFGRAWQAKQTLTDAAREGARIAAVANGQYTTDTVQAKVKAMVQSAGFDSSAVTITYPLGCHFTGCSPQLITGQITAVALAMPHRFVALHRMITLATSGGVLTLRTTARMRVE
jgi:Flp pilus assembly protein TadG